MKILPGLEGRPSGKVNLEKLAYDYLQEMRLKLGEKNPLIDPSECQKLIAKTHRAYNLVWSYGGYDEYRPTLWQDSYLAKEQKYLHLGVDFNVSAGQEVAAPWEAEVLEVDLDEDQEGGWGGSTILRPIGEEFFNVYIFAHLSDQIKTRVGDVLKAGEVFGAVGKPEVNGGWFSHLHVQAIAKSFYNKSKPTDLADIDGYAKWSDRQKSLLQHPDPLREINLF